MTNHVSELVDGNSEALFLALELLVVFSDELEVAHEDHLPLLLLLLSLVLPHELGLKPRTQSSRKPSLYKLTIIL